MAKMLLITLIDDTSEAMGQVRFPENSYGVHVSLSGDKLQDMEAHTNVFVESFITPAIKHLARETVERNQ